MAVRGSYCVDPVYVGSTVKHYAAATIDRLDAFGTRHTFSDTTSDDRGIGAARRWLRDQMQAMADASGRDDITVELMRHTQAAGPAKITPAGEGRILFGPGEQGGKRCGREAALPPVTGRREREFDFGPLLSRRQVGQTKAIRRGSKRSPRDGQGDMNDLRNEIRVLGTKATASTQLLRDRLDLVAVTG